MAARHLEACCGSLPARRTHESIGSTVVVAARTLSRMKPQLSGFVSLHPYFKVHAGKLDAFKASLPDFVAKTAMREKTLFYGFTVSGDEVFCREGYADAEGVLAHLENVGALLAEALKIAELTRIELHGPAAELDKLRGPLAHLSPKWFVTERERE